MIRELLDAGLLHDDVFTVLGRACAPPQEPTLQEGQNWPGAMPRPAVSTESAARREEPFSADGGLKLLQGNLGRSVIKVSAVKPEHRVVRAPAIVFETIRRPAAPCIKPGCNAISSPWCASRARAPTACRAAQTHAAAGQICGMPASGGPGHRRAACPAHPGKVPAAIHLAGSAVGDDPLSKVRDGDMILLDAERGCYGTGGDAEWQAERRPWPTSAPTSTAWARTVRPVPRPPPRRAGRQRLRRRFVGRISIRNRASIKSNRVGLKSDPIELAARSGIGLQSKAVSQ